MRAICAAVALLAAACGASDRPPQGATPPEGASAVNPARIDRVRDDLPDGYEVATVSGPVAPTALWGYGSLWLAEPPQCGLLADPVVDPASTKGWSGSGAGGIVYAVVADLAVGLDPGVAAECQHWTLSAGQTSGTVTLTTAPTIEDAQTLAMATSTKTVVEGGTETRSHADTVTAYLDSHVAFVTVVTDPGSPNPQLNADFASELMVKTVAALRG
ncbi:DUF5642 family protein [Mycolicibacterium moriokaense]|uniref:DUF5642 domain-containing protein n=1 Tax=Mycolicibacterium moriokaense TaxID=39691 RepID=A0AAD1M5W1_9MYCO|nr:DUF5642 family protein [Mycolicibacterium moriokaense]BBX00735.1 hypothetical protein MMOR_16710 [Mycolicibacterium moriokaense]